MPGLGLPGRWADRPETRCVGTRRWQSSRCLV